MKWLTKVVLILVAAHTVNASAQSTTQKTDSARETQSRGYWVDPATGLMWAAKDNGKDVSWRGAMKYCRNFRLAGYSNWRLATVNELQNIFDAKLESPGLAGLGKGSADTWHVKGNLFLTGNQWINNPNKDDLKHIESYEWYFDFNEGRAENEPSGFPYPNSFRRALCVRSPQN